jgi:hypothetical protein
MVGICPDVMGFMAAASLYGFPLAPYWKRIPTAEVKACQSYIHFDYSVSSIHLRIQNDLAML